ncbi:MAG: LysM peptidoglycan-binding domain-containing protein [Tissierellales bacterium]
MKQLKKKLLIGALTFTIAATSSSAFAGTHTTKPGDTYWKISTWYGVTLENLLKANGATYTSILYIGQKVYIPENISYKTHLVQKGDDLWKLSIKYGVPVNDIAKASNISTSKVLYIGDVIKVPVHNVAVKATPGPQYGELLDWWTEAQYVLPINSEFKVTDFYTGKSFRVKRTVGASHIDAETLTLNDTNIMKNIWGGTLSWVRRPILIEYNGRKIAASMTSAPHAGNEKGAGGTYTSWRSGGYGAGTNFDYVKGNGIDGHFDIHFLNCTKHSDGKVDAGHQKNVKIAAGVK